MIKVLFNNYVAKVDYITFPGGEEHVTIKKPIAVDPSEVVVVVRPTSAKLREQLDLVVDAIRNMLVGVKYNLVVHFEYLPFARQDRVANHGECFSLKKYAERINSLKADAVIVDDCHSNVGLALIDNVVHRDFIFQMVVDSEIYNQFLEDNTVILAPDAGAVKNAHAVAKKVGGIPVISSDKVRDTKTGNILGTKLNFSAEDIDGKNVIIVDDICDGGRTFIEISKAIKSAGFSPKALKLVVTHGIFSKGRELLEEYFDKVYAVHDWTKEK